MKPTNKTNVIYHPAMISMGSDAAVNMHLKNLVETYGFEKVLERMQHLQHVQKTKNRKTG